MNKHLRLEIHNKKAPPNNYWKTHSITLKTGWIKCDRLNSDKMEYILFG